MTREHREYGCPVRTLILISIPWPVMAVAAVLRDLVPSVTCIINMLWFTVIAKV